MAELTRDIVESTFRQKVNDFLNEVKSPVVNDWLLLVINFYTNYPIQNVDSAIPDNDMLLFEYGIFDWQDGKGENYTIDITRQFYIEAENSEGFFQLHLVLYYNSEDFRSSRSSDRWSVDFENVEGWKNYVVNSEGFKMAESKHPKTFDIFLTETD